MTFTCGICWREFPAGWRSREQHFEATGHEEPNFECDTCDRYFGTQNTKNQHMTALNHWREYECDDCSDGFYDEDDLRNHEASKHFYCDPCDRYFDSYNSIKNHRNSKIHRTERSNCPFCGKAYSTVTGIIHHLEQGSCAKAPLDRSKLYEAVRKRDPDGLLTKKLLSWPDAGTFHSTKKSWNSEAEAFECYFCHRLFARQSSLDQHLNSPVHQQSLYHCPNGSCKKEFTSLAAVSNHLESESCQFMRFENVQQSFQNVMDSGRLIKF